MAEPRICSQAETRSWTWGKWLPLRRSLDANQGESAELELRLWMVRALIVKRLASMYRPEWATLDDRVRKHMLIALAALTDFESWGRMRVRCGLSVERGCALWIRIIDRILPPTPAG